MLKTTSVGDTRARLFGTGADEGRRFGTEIGDFCDLGCLKQFGLKKSYKQVRIVRIVLDRSRQSEAYAQHHTVQRSHLPDVVFLCCESFPSVVIYLMPT